MTSPTTDLATVPDHPAIVLDKRAAQAAEGNHRQQSSALYGAAKALRAHERDHGVTFAALDNDGLAAVREAYAEAQDAPQHVADRILREDFVSAVRDLLGLDG